MINVNIKHPKRYGEYCRYHVRQYLNLPLDVDITQCINDEYSYEDKRYNKYKHGGCKGGHSTPTYYCSCLSDDASDSDTDDWSGKRHFAAHLESCSNESCSSEEEGGVKIHTSNCTRVNNKCQRFSDMKNCLHKAEYNGFCKYHIGFHLNVIFTG